MVKGPLTTSSVTYKYSDVARGKLCGPFLYTEDAGVVGVLGLRA